MVSGAQRMSRALCSRWLFLAEGRVPVFFQWQCEQDGTNGTSKLVEMVASVLIAYHYIKLSIFNGVPLGENGDFF